MHRSRSPTRCATPNGCWTRWLEEAVAFLPAAPDHGDPLFVGLTQRQHELLDLIAQGRDNAQIAAMLSLSEKTVRNHRRDPAARADRQERAE